MAASIARSELWGRALLLCAAILPLLLTLALVFVLAFGAAEEIDAGGFSTLAVLTWGTLKVVLGAMILVVPLGVAIAVLMSEMVSARARRRFKPVAEVLAAVPTVVWGWFALVALTPALSTIIPDLPPTSTVSATIAVGLMVLPTFLTLADDALFAVPTQLREGAYALGADRWATTVHVVFPAASPGLFSAALLAVARATGESMIVLLAAGGIAQWGVDPRMPVLTLPAAIAQAGIRLGPDPEGSRLPVFVIAGFLMVVVLTLSGASQALMRRSVAR